ncbi:polysaccharide biosynthesis protein [Limnohabitans sp. 2KL-1]|uniref:polysaccharide biosynthesis protein n=1 Tax=Limnohabitans sp. 2KL-1 TaxID=1100699 RepID=UPI000D3BC241|nr:nucleoside-diphosphate sugar epimerase/dehydratase [Limnohabitans sp. 2KL-1]PUE49049.1 polysaccharide biosynthesis protein [Limnohabitans sp. 2KL-1]
MIRIPLWFLAWPRWSKQVTVLLLDAFLCALTLWAALALRQEAWVPWSKTLELLTLVSMLLALPLFIVFGLYRAIFRYAGLVAFVAMGQALAIYAVLFAGWVMWVGLPGIPRSVGLIQPLLLLMAVGGSRACVRAWLGGVRRKARQPLVGDRVLIYGAGSVGRQLAIALEHSADLRVVGFLDDDVSLHGHVLNGVRIAGFPDLPRLIASERVSLVLMAIPSASRVRRNQILECLRLYKLKVRTLPGLEDLARGRVDASLLRELDVTDLLGRDQVPPHQDLMAKNIAGKVVMVTGAGGSIGSELCRQIVRLGPEVLLLVELTEFALYSVHQELERLVMESAPSDVILVPLLANVRDAVRIGEIMSTWKPHTVYHAAAYKHVPLVEHNPAEGVKNNLHGTWITALQATLHGVSDFVLVSTDKAVRPTNIMGASKRLAEMVLQALAEVMVERRGKTCFSMVRFGNVLGSSGSVVPLFRRQIDEGGPITLTDARITRYFMTIPEAAQLVIQAGAMATGGDVYVLDMGESVKIMDLARRMVDLSGLSVKDAENPDGDIEIRVTGLRPGEKLYEELLIGDNPLPTSHSRILKAHEDFLPWDVLQTKLAKLNELLDLNNVPQIRRVLKEVVPGYQPDGDVVDWVWMENERHVSN